MNDETKSETNIYRCRACGHNHTLPAYCDCCGTPICPKCKRPNVIMNITAMRRMVSDKLPTNPKKRKSIDQRKRQKRAKAKKQSDLIARMQADHQRLVEKGKVKPNGAHDK